MNQRRRKSRRTSAAPLIAILLLFAIIAAAVIAVAVNSRNKPPVTATSTNEPKVTVTSDPTTPVTSEPTRPATADPTSPVTAEPTAPVTAEPTSPVTPEPTKPVNPPATDVITPPTKVSANQLAKTADAGMEYIDKMVFLGDSTTYHMLIRDTYNDDKGSPLADGKHNSNVWTGTSHTLTLQYVNLDSTKIYYAATGEELTVKEAVAKSKPEIFVITLGINGVLYMPEAYFKDVYTTLVKNVQAASPNTKIILNSMFPVQKFYSDNGSNGKEGIPQWKVDIGNGWIMDMADELGVYYLNSAECLKNAEGYLPDGYSKGDGVHLSNKAYEILFDYIRTHAIPEYVK